MRLFVMELAKSGKELRLTVQIQVDSCSDIHHCVEITSIYTRKALNICNSETEHLANEFARLAGETKTEVGRKVLSMHLQRLKQQKETEGLAEELNEIAKLCAKLPVLDKRSEDKMLYDKNGFPL